MKSEQLNNYLEVKQQTNRDIRQMGVLVSESYEADSTDGQTVINLNFSIDINNKKQIWVFVDGFKLVEGSTSNYTFTNIVGSLSSQITLNSPLMAGLPIQVYKIGAYQETLPNPSSVTATLLNDVAQPHKMAQDAFQPFVKKDFITAPNTTIVNRAKVESASLKAIAGVERVMTRSIVLSLKEFGSNGEQVFEIDSKDSRIRFVGNWFQNSNAYGNYIHTNTVGDYVEVSFYGTGLNSLIIANNPDSWLVSIDGGSDSALVLPVLSGVLAQRNYSPNQVVNIVSGLALGWHTVKIKNNNATYGMPTHGFEILNQRTDLAVLAGTAYCGMKQEVLSALSSSAFNAGVVGTRGARVVKYLKDGVISQAATEVNPASTFLASTDHSNEEVVRKINFREFGANRADDFSTLSTARVSAFTLDDGTTTLVANSASVSGDELRVTTGNTNFVTLTFVGTGLDIVSGVANANGSGITPIIDGVSVGSVIGFGVGEASKLVKICSGLPYGTHTVKLLNAYASADFGIKDFIIYQPKKPSIPVGAVEIADYNVMANYSFNSNVGQVSAGVVRKIAIREAIYSGTWVIPLNDSGFESGVNLNTVTPSSYVEYNFYGTGVEFLTFFASGTVNATVSIDGSNNLSSYTTQLIGNTLGTAVFTASTGAITGTIATGAYNTRVRVTGLSLGSHKIRITQNGTVAMYSAGFDVVTPTHINSSSLKIGSLSLKDTRVFSPIVDKPEKIDMNKAKAWCLLDSGSNKILASNNIASVLIPSAGTNIFFFEKPFKSANYVANATVNDQTSLGSNGSNYFANISYKQNNLVQTTTIRNDGTQTSRVISVICFGELEDEQEF